MIITTAQNVWAQNSEVQPDPECITLEEHTSNSSIQITSDFGHKIVYRTDADADKAPLIKDCEQHSGTFSECGSPCDDDTQTCVTVCAFTCENIPQQPDDNNKQEPE